MLDCLARLVNKKKPLGADEVALAGDRVVKNPSTVGRTYSPYGYCIRRPRGHRNFLLCYRNKQQGKKTIDMKKSH